MLFFFWRAPSSIFVAYEIESLVLKGLCWPWLGSGCYVRTYLLIPSRVTVYSPDCNLGNHLDDGWWGRVGEGVLLLEGGFEKTVTWLSSLF